MTAADIGLSDYANFRACSRASSVYSRWASLESALWAHGYEGFGRPPTGCPHCLPYCLPASLTFCLAVSIPSYVSACISGLTVEETWEILSHPHRDAGSSCWNRWATPSLLDRHSVCTVCCSDSGLIRCLWLRLFTSKGRFLLFPTDSRESEVVLSLGPL